VEPLAHLVVLVTRVLRDHLVQQDNKDCKAQLVLLVQKVLQEEQVTKECQVALVNQVHLVHLDCQASKDHLVPREFLVP